MGQACCTDDTSTRTQIESVDRQKSPPPSQPSEDVGVPCVKIVEKDVVVTVSKSDAAEGAAQKTSSSASTDAKLTSTGKEAESDPSVQQVEKKKTAESPEESEPGKTKESSTAQQETPAPRLSSAVDGTKSGGAGAKGGKQIKDDRRPSVSATAQGAPFPKRPAKDVLSLKVWETAEAVFKKLDVDGSNAVTREEAMVFFTGAFGTISVDAMFRSIDVDMSGAITGEEFMHFWKQVKAAGHSDADILEEMEEILEGSGWVDMNVGQTAKAADMYTFPKRPWFCRLSAEAWNKCEELFRAIATKKGELVITREKANAYFGKEGSFGQMSANAMFHEVDTMNHGQIAPKAFMDFWKQVRSSGYSNKQIMEEIGNMLEGGGWVDWNDGRTT